MPKALAEITSSDTKALWGFTEAPDAQSSFSSLIFIHAPGSYMHPEGVGSILGWQSLNMGGWLMLLNAQWSKKPFNTPNLSSRDSRGTTESSSKKITLLCAVAEKGYISYILLKQTLYQAHSQALSQAVPKHSTRPVPKHSTRPIPKHSTRPIPKTHSQLLNLQSS